MQKGPGSYFNITTKQINERKKQQTRNIQKKNLLGQDQQNLDQQNHQLQIEIEELEDGLERVIRRSETPAFGGGAEEYEERGGMEEEMEVGDQEVDMALRESRRVAEQMAEQMQMDRGGSRKTLELEFPPPSKQKKYLSVQDSSMGSSSMMGSAGPYEEEEDDEETEEQEEEQQREQIRQNLFAGVHGVHNDPRILELEETGLPWCFSGGKRATVNRRCFGGVAHLAKGPLKAQITMQSNAGIYAYRRSIERSHNRRNRHSYRCLRCEAINTSQGFLQKPGEVPFFILTKPECAEGDVTAIEWPPGRDEHLPGCVPITQPLTCGGKARIPPDFPPEWRTMLELSTDYGRENVLRDTSNYIVLDAVNRAVYIGKANGLVGRLRQHSQSGILAPDGHMLVALTGLTHSEALCLECILHLGAKFLENEREEERRKREEEGTEKVLQSNESTNVEDEEWLRAAMDYGLKLTEMGTYLIRWITRPENVSKYECKKGVLLWNRFVAV